MIKSEILYFYAMLEMWLSEKWLSKKVLLEKSRATEIYRLKVIVQKLCRWHRHFCLSFSLAERSDSKTWSQSYKGDKTVV